MGYFDRVLGKRSAKDKQEEQSHAEVAQPSSAPEIVHDAAPASSFGPPSISSNSINTSSSALGSMSFPGAGGMSGGAGGEHSARLYDPYEGISQAVGTGMRKQIFKLPEQPEFLFEEEATVRRRGWGENLQFYTGLGYISGAGAGVVAGGYRLLTTKPELQGPDTMKLKANRALNSVSMYARPLSNGAGILGLFFSTADSLIFNQLDQYGLPDSLSSVFAGAVSGAVFRSPRGPRQAMVAGAVGAVAGAGIVAARTVFPSL